MTATTATRYGAEYGYESQMDGILAYINGGGYTPDQQETLAEKLLSELWEEVDDRLPEGMTWHPHASEFIRPVDVDRPDDDEIDEIFTEAWAAVEARHAEIERVLFGDLPATIEDLEAALRAIGDPVHRARVAGLLVDASMRQMAGRVRAEAVYAATRERSWEDVATLLGTGVKAVGKMITQHNARQKTS